MPISEHKGAKRPLVYQVLDREFNLQNFTGKKPEKLILVMTMKMSHWFQLVFLSLTNFNCLGNTRCSIWDRAIKWTSWCCDSPTSPVPGPGSTADSQASTAQLFQHSPKTAFRMWLLCLDHLMHIIQSFFLEEHKEGNKPSTKSSVFLSLHTGLDVTLQHYLPACLHSYPWYLHCRGGVFGPATNSWYRCKASFQNMAGGNNFWSNRKEIDTSGIKRRGSIFSFILHHRDFAKGYKWCNCLHAWWESSLEEHGCEPLEARLYNR